MQFLPLRNSHLKFQQLCCGRNKTLDLLSTSCKCVCETNFFPFPSPVTCVGYVKWFLPPPLCSSINHNLCTMPSKSLCQLLMYICPLSLSFQLLLFSQDTEQRRVKKQHWSLVASYYSTVRPGHGSALNSHSEIQVPFTVNITIINAQTPQLLQKGTECRALYWRSYGWDWMWFIPLCPPILVLSLASDARLIVVLRCTFAFWIHSLPLSPRLCVQSSWTPHCNCPSLSAVPLPSLLSPLLTSVQASPLSPRLLQNLLRSSSWLSTFPFQPSCFLPTELSY